MRVNDVNGDPLPDWWHDLTRALLSKTINSYSPVAAKKVEHLRQDLREMGVGFDLVSGRFFRLPRSSTGMVEE